MDESAHSFQSPRQLNESALVSRIETEGDEQLKKLNDLLEVKHQGIPFGTYDLMLAPQGNGLLEKGEFYHLFGIHHAGEASLRYAKDISSHYFQLYDEEKRKRLEDVGKGSEIIELANATNPVLVLSPEDAEKLLNDPEFYEGQNVVIKKLMTARVWVAALQGKIPQETADLFPKGSMTYFLHHNYPTGLNVIGSGRLTDEYVLNPNEYVSLKYAESLYTGDAEKMLQYRKKYEERKKSLGLPDDYHDDIFHVIHLTPELVHQYRQWKEDFRTTQDRNTKLTADKMFASKSLLPMAERTAAFFEDLLHHLATKYLQQETEWIGIERPA